jgi:hypothetical protein
MSRRPPRRGPWYLLTGLVTGVILGLVYSYLISPVTYTDLGPNLLNADSKARYRSMVALAYRSNNDLGRAKARLALLQDDSPAEALAAQAQASLADGTLQQEARALAALAAGMSLKSYSGAVTQPASMLSQTPGPVVTVTMLFGRTPAPGTLTAAAMTPTSPALPTPTISSTPFPTTVGSPQPSATTRPSPTATRTPGAPFNMREKQSLCNPQLPPGLLQVEVQDASGKGVAGMRVTITWSGGSDNFYTGLYPQISPGYADYTMTPDVVYSVRVGEAGDIASGLSAARCQATGGSSYLGGWKLRFSQ